MQVIDVLVKNINESLTISEAVAILADQENVPDISHVHMHARDGFSNSVKASLLQGSTPTQYEEAHMTTAARALAQGIPVWAGTGHAPKDRFHLNATRVATALSNSRSKYDMRSNLPEISGQAATGELRPYLMKYSPALGKYEYIAAALPPVPIIGDVGDINTVVQSRGAATSVAIARPAIGPDYKRVAPGGNATVTYKYEALTPGVKAIPKSEKHTMFEDSEVMAMYLCAALRSTAGFNMLNVLSLKKPGENGTVSLFSKTAVQQVNRHIAESNKKLGTNHALPNVIERVTNIDVSVPRTPDNPNPALETFTHASKPIDHIVLVMGRRGDGNLNITTFYPSADTTAVSMQVCNVGNIDLEEPVAFGPKNRIAVDKKIVMKW